MPRNLRFEAAGGPDERHAQIEMPRSRQGAVDDGSRSLVAAHRVNGNPDHLSWLLFVDSPGLASLVVSAVRTDPMRRFGLVAVRALAEAHGFERIVRAALGRARLGMSSFWIRHRLSQASVPRITRRGAFAAALPAEDSASLSVPVGCFSASPAPPGGDPPSRSRSCTRRD